MRARALTVAMLAIFALLWATPLSAVETADDADHGSRYDGVMPVQEREWEGGVPGSPSEHSSSPQSFSPCVRGMAAGMFPCKNVDLLSWVPHGALGTTFVNDIWGWTAPQTRRDYALVGASNGTVFVDITDPRRPAVLGILPTASTSGGAFWRDIKVYRDHAYVTSEHNFRGVQVFDLTELRDWDGTYTTYEQTNRYTDIGRAHNIAINEDTGFAYAVGANNAQDTHDCNFGLHMIDLSEPANPTFAGCYGDNGYVHDTQCVVYAGPDSRYQGREICFNSNAAGAFGSADHWVEVVDVTDKDNPVSLSRETYPEAGYSHQGWLTPDQQYFLHGDEGDELTHSINTTTRVWDVRDLENIELVEAFRYDTAAIDHNIYTQGRYAYASNYTAGLRVLDIRGVGDTGLREVGYFDVFPEHDNASFEGGTWSNFPYFRQKGVVAVSSIDRGLFIVQPRVGRAGN
jgi:choice-of-anchor B domain-containing protein